MRIRLHLRRLEETNQDAETLEQYVYNLSTATVAGNEWFIATQVGNVLVVAAGGGGSGAKRVQFRSTTKMTNGQITGVVILSEGGLPLGSTQVFNDPFNLFFSGEPDAIGWAYYRPADEHCDLDQGRWEVEELSLPLDECIGTVSECLKKTDDDAAVVVEIKRLAQHVVAISQRGSAARIQRFNEHDHGKKHFQSRHMRSEES